MKRPMMRTAAEAAGIIAIVFSLVLLAIEINQSNRIAIASIQYDILADYNEYHRQVLADPDLGVFVARLKIADDIALSLGDQARAHAFVTIFINIWFAIETAHEEGQLTDDTYKVYLEDARSMLAAYPKAVPYFRESIQSSPSLHHLEIFQPIFEARDALVHWLSKEIIGLIYLRSGNDRYWPEADTQMVSGERLVLVKADTQIGEFDFSVIERLLYARNQPFAEGILSDW